MPEQLEGLGERIGQLRRREGWSQAELAARVGITKSQVSKYERGACEPRLTVLSLIAQVFETSVHYLVTGQEPTLPDRLSTLWPFVMRLPLGLRNEVAAFLETIVRAGYLLAPPQPQAR